MEKVKTQLDKCRESLCKGSSVLDSEFLNLFCLELFVFSQTLHKFLIKFNQQEEQDAMGDALLCLTQIMICVKYLEKTIKLEIEHDVIISAARQHFLDRLHSCLERLGSCVSFLCKKDDEKALNVVTEENSFVALMDLILEQMRPYTSYKDDTQPLSVLIERNVRAFKAQEAVFVSQQIRDSVNIAIGHSLDFANVALESDKKALTALSLKVLSECIAWQTECQSSLRNPNHCIDSKCRVKANSLENALYKLEDFINDALLRLVYRCLLDFEKFSIEKLRMLIDQRESDDTAIDEVIADFDVNLDRTTQIGIFAVCFAPNKQIKTLVRNCLSSFESLDSCIIPSLYAKGNSQLYSQLLECHFKEEVNNFKTAILEIVDSQEFAACFYDLLNECIQINEKNYNRSSLQEITQMGDILKQHFLLPINQKLLLKNDTGFELFKKFCVILSECQAILQTSVCVDMQRIIKRFKILRCKLKRLIKGLNEDFNNINYCDSDKFGHSGNENNDSKTLIATRMKSNISKGSKLAPLTGRSLSKSNSCLSLTAIGGRDGEGQSLSSARQQTGIRKRESLRTTMFKRKKSAKTEELFNSYIDLSEGRKLPKF
uniref:Serendipity locus protein alpha n=1 Tax=Glossina brevipalpis TaxID=37001 RepID=A0A1A9WQY2_9MUSC